MLSRPVWLELVLLEEYRTSKAAVKLSLINVSHKSSSLPRHWYGVWDGTIHLDRTSKIGKVGVEAMSEKHGDQYHTYSIWAASGNWARKNAKHFFAAAEWWVQHSYYTQSFTDAPPFICCSSGERSKPPQTCPRLSFVNIASNREETLVYFSNSRINCKFGRVSTCALSLLLWLPLTLYILRGLPTIETPSRNVSTKLMWWCEWEIFYSNRQ